MKSLLIRHVVSGVLSAIVLSLSVPTVVGAQAPDSVQSVDSALGRPEGPARFLGPLLPILRRLKLTADERTQIREIVQGHRTDFQTLIRRGIVAWRGLFEAVFLDPFDEGLIRDRSAGVATIQADEAVLRTTVRTEIFGVLTPDQQARATHALQALEDRRRGQFEASSERED